jgi:hypothetical protein
LHCSISRQPVNALSNQSGQKSRKSFGKKPVLNSWSFLNSPVVEFVSVIVGRDDIQQKNIFRLGVQPGNAKLHLWKHLPKRDFKKRNAFSAQLKNLRCYDNAVQIRNTPSYTGYIYYSHPISKRKG